MRARMENSCAGGGGAIEHISVATSHAVNQTAQAAIRRALDEGDPAKAERLRRIFVEKRINGA